MKHKHLSLTVAAAIAALTAGQASAQSSVTLYGLIDVSALTYQNAQDAQGHHGIGMGVFNAGAGEPWFSGSRWGITGAEDLGGGTKAIFRLESEFVATTGEAEDGSQIFDRDAWVGFQDDRFGKLTIGFQNTIARDAAAIYGDPYGSAELRYDEGGWTNANNFKQMIFYAGTANGATRYTNGLAWKKLFDNGVFTSAGYQFGEQAGAFGDNSAMQGAIGYNGGPFNVSGFYSHTNSYSSTLLTKFANDTFSFGGNYTFGIVRLNAGYFNYTGQQLGGTKRKDNAWTISTKISPTTTYDFELGFQQMRTKNAEYNAAGDIPNANQATFDSTQSSTLHNGTKNTLYTSAFYHLTKRTEFYVAADYMKLNGGYTVAATNGAKSQVEMALGIRTRF